MKQYLKSSCVNLTFAILALAAAFLGIADPVAMTAIAIALTTSTAQLGNGTIVQISAGSPTSYLTINNVKNVEFHNGQSAEVDTTNLTSTWRERLLGLPDGGTITFEVDTDLGDAGQAAALAAKNARTICDFKIILPAGTTPNITCRGFVRKFPIRTAVDSTVSTQAEFVVTGPFTFA